MGTRRRRKPRVTKFDLMRAEMSILSAEIRGMRIDLTTMSGLRGQIEAMADRVAVMERIALRAFCQTPE